MTGPRKHCVLAYATRERQHLWQLSLPPEASVEDALQAARQTSDCPEIDWEGAPVGIFGEICPRSTIPREGDRIEIYRPLTDDPRERRRARARPRR